MDIQEAIAFLKAAGYSVSKPRQRNKKLAMIGPTFRALWPDGEITRMTIHSGDENPDLGRAVRVSLAAYEARCRRLKAPFFPDRIVEGTFERDGNVLHSYTDLPVMEYSHA